MTRFLTRDCDCTVQTGTGQARPEECMHGNHYLTNAEFDPPLRQPLAKVSKKRQAEEEAGTRKRTVGSTLAQGNGFAVEPLQRAKVKGLVCVYCGADPYEGGLIDPAHLIPRSVVSCKHPEGIIPLCRRCHGLYDEEHLDILSRLEDRGYHTEMGHYITKHQVNPLTLLRYVTGSEYVPASQHSEVTG